MPLRDHFHPPLTNEHRWDSVHAGWPMEIVRTLFDRLPKGFVAAPGVHLGSPIEVDVATFERDDRPPFVRDEGGVATLVAVAEPLTVPADLSASDEYEVLVYDLGRQRTLVAAIEIVSPSNKDRPATRDQFLSKVESLLRQEVCVTVIDIVTTPQANLYAELLARHGQSDPRAGTPPVSLYAATMRGRWPKRQRPVLDLWHYPLTLGQPLPTVPLWLAPDMAIELPLEPGYEEVCRLLRVA